MRTLEVKDIHTYYGTSHVLFSISLSLDKGESVAVLGRNGAGKTTTLWSMMGLAPPRSGSIKFRGKEIRGKTPYFIARQGLGYVPDDRLIFPDLKVWENLDIAFRKTAEGEGGWNMERIYKLFPVLKERKNQLGGH